MAIWSRMRIPYHFHIFHHLGFSIYEHLWYSHWLILMILGEMTRAEENESTTFMD